MSEKTNAVRRFFRHRQHPLKLIDYTSRNLWLLLIPLSKYLIASRFDFQSWIKTNWVDILAITGIFAIAVLRWAFVRFNIENDGIVAYTGLFGIVKTKVFFSEMTTVSFCQSWYNRLFKAHTIYIETNAQTVTDEDIKLVMSQKNADVLYDFLTTLSDDKPKVSFSPKKSHLMVFSLLFTSILSGIILFATFMFEAYKIVGFETEQQVIQRVNDGITAVDSQFLNISKTIPGAILVVAGIVIAGWFISFIATLSRHWSFTVARTDNQLLVKSGVMIKRRHIINRSMVNYYDITQTLLMKIFKICSVTLDCTGYGKRRREISALIPITTYQQMNASLKLLVPDLPKPKPEVRTSGKDVPRFVFFPVIFCAIPPVAIKVLQYFFADRFADLNSLIVIAAVPLIWLVVVKTAAAFNTSVGFSDKGCVLNYCKGYKFHKLLFPKQNISKMRITRNPIQLINHTCTLWVYTVSEKQTCHKLKYMPYEDVRSLCLREGYVMFE
ncbi:MAG: PH domain-containing protein [Ruminococcus sp.]|nr:PH domain-containing protein [Ruminococcus sp.]